MGHIIYHILYMDHIIWVGDNCLMLMTDLTIFVTNVLYLLVFACQNWKIIQEMAMANIRLSLEIHFAMFYHFHHGLLCWSMDRHGCPDNPDRDLPPRTVNISDSREKEHHLVLINIQFGVSWLDLQWHFQGKVDQYECLEVLIGKTVKIFNRQKVWYGFLVILL